MKSVVWHFLIGFHNYAFNAIVSLSFLYLTICMCKSPENFTVNWWWSSWLAVIVLEFLEHLCYMLIKSS